MKCVRVGSKPWLILDCTFSAKISTSEQLTLGLWFEYLAEQVSNCAVQLHIVHSDVFCLSPCDFNRLEQGARCTACGRYSKIYVLWHCV